MTANGMSWREFKTEVDRIMKETSTIGLDDLVHEGNEETCDECGMAECECGTNESNDAVGFTAKFSANKIILPRLSKSILLNSVIA